MIVALIYFWRFALFFCAELAFFYWIPSIACRPLAALQTEEVVPGPIPPEATCYTVDHGIVVFRDYRPFEQAPIPYVLTAILALTLLSSFFSPRFWTRGRGASEPHQSVAGNRADESVSDPFAASKANTLRQLVAVFRHRFGLGPFVLAGALAAFALLTIVPALREYIGLIFFAVPAAAGAVFLGKPTTPGASAIHKS